MRVLTDFDLTNFNSYRIPAKCAIAYFPDSEEELVGLFKEQRRDFIILGAGNNTIMSKEYYSSSFIILNGCLNDLTINGHTIEAGAGATILQVCELALANKLTELEFYYDIPSSVG